MAIAERIGNARHRLAEMSAGRLAIRNILRNLAQTVHVVDENNQARRAIGRYNARMLELFEGLADVGRPQNLRHSAEMRHARRTEAALENRRTTGLVARDAIGDLFGLLVGPQIKFRLRLRFGRHDASYSSSGCRPRRICATASCTHGSICSSRTF